MTPERETEAVLRNVVTAIAATLRPGAMLACPALRPILLPCTMPLPSAVLCPPSLLLPRDCLLLGTLRLLVLLLGRLGTLCLLLLRLLLLRLLGPLLLLLRRLLGPLLLLLRRLLSPLLLLLLRRLLSPLLLLRLLCPLLLLLLLLLLRLLCPLLLVLRGLLGPRLLLLRGLLGPRLLLLLLLLPFRLALFLIALRVGRVNRPEKQKQGSGTDHSKKLHRNRSPLISLLGMHANDQSAPNHAPLPNRPNVFLCPRGPNQAPETARMRRCGVGRHA